VFKEFMENALKDTPPVPFRIPPGVRMVQVNAKTGHPTYPGDSNAIWEPFLAGTEPNNDMDYTPPTSTSAADAPYTVNEPLPAAEMLQPNPDSNSLSGTGGIY
jgi:penicillin-binding protein 1A